MRCRTFTERKKMASKESLRRGGERTRVRVGRGGRAIEWHLRMGG